MTRNEVHQTGLDMAAPGVVSTGKYVVAIGEEMAVYVWDDCDEKWIPETEVPAGFPASFVFRDASVALEFPSSS